MTLRGVIEWAEFHWPRSANFTLCLSAPLYLIHRRFWCGGVRKAWMTCSLRSVITIRWYLIRALIMRRIIPCGIRLFATGDRFGRRFIKLNTRLVFDISRRRAPPRLHASPVLPSHTGTAAWHFCRLPATRFESRDTIYGRFALSRHGGLQHFIRL